MPMWGWRSLSAVKSSMLARLNNARGVPPQPQYLYPASNSRFPPSCLASNQFRLRTPSSRSLSELGQTPRYGRYRSLRSRICPLTISLDQTHQQSVLVFGSRQVTIRSASIMREIDVPAGTASRKWGTVSEFRIARLFDSSTYVL